MSSEKPLLLEPVDGTAEPGEDGVLVWRQGTRVLHLSHRHQTQDLVQLLRQGALRRELKLNCRIIV